MKEVEKVYDHLEVSKIKCGVMKGEKSELKKRVKKNEKKMVERLDTSKSFSRAIVSVLLGLEFILPSKQE